MTKRRRPAQRASTSAEMDYGRLAAEMVKALNLPAGTVTTAIAPPAPPQPGPNAWTGATAPPFVPGGWSLPAVPFGPGHPVRPAAIDPIDPITGRPLPRRTEYPVSVNLPGVEDRMIPWTLLRKVADASIVRRCIEIRKAEMIAQEWDITVSPMALQRAMMMSTQTPADAVRNKAAAEGDGQALVDQGQRSGVSSRSLEREMLAKNARDIMRIKEFWLTPDRSNDLTFDDWMMTMLEEHFVLDALTIFPRETFGGQLYALEIIDGSTIKPLLNNRGGIPAPPDPAYQQILHGFPRGEFLATGEADGEYAKNSLVYRPRYRRAHSPYGMSNVEQAIVNADLYMKRIEWIRAEYTSGVIPEMFIALDVNLSPEQIMAYERVYNNRLSGNTEERHRAKVFPKGMVPKQLQNFEERYKPDYDLHLIRLVANDFDVMPTELGFAPSGGLGGKGLSEGEENTTYRKGTRPLARWCVDTYNMLSVRWLGMGPDLTFKFLGLESEDEGMAQQIMEAQFHNAGLTANEMRDQIGQPRYPIPDADMPFIITGRDIVPLAGSFDRANAAALSMVNPQAPEPQVGAQPTPGSKPVSPKKSSGEGNDTAGKPVKATTPALTTGASDQGDNTGNAFKKLADAERAELKSFKSYVRNHRRRDRPWEDFTFNVVGNGQALELNRTAALAPRAALDIADDMMEMHDD